MIKEWLETDSNVKVRTRESTPWFPECTNWGKSRFHLRIKGNLIGKLGPRAIDYLKNRKRPPTEDSDGGKYLSSQDGVHEDQPRVGDPIENDRVWKGFVMTPNRRQPCTRSYVSSPWWGPLFPEFRVLSPDFIEIDRRTSCVWDQSKE